MMKRLFRSRPLRASLWLAVWSFGLFGLLVTTTSRADDGAPEEYADLASSPESAADADAAPTDDIPRLSESGGAGDRVLVIPINGTIDLGLAPYVRRLLAGDPNYAAVILDVDTFGGRVDAAVQIRDALLSTDAPVVAFVNRRAISAGALISLAADTIVFTPGGTMGAATPVQLQGGEAAPVEEKMVSYMRSEMRATAEATGRSGDIAEAMVDADVAIEGVTEEGKLLTLTTDSARATGVSAGQAADLPALLDALGLGRAEVQRPEASWAEKLARILTDPTFSGILMSVGMLGLLMELYTPGFGWTGAIGLTCLATFFFGHMVVDLAGWEEALLFLAGLVALGLEAFVFPGFGISGVLGIALVGTSLVLAMVGLPVDVSWEVGAIESALGTVLLSLAGTVIGLIALVRFLPGRDGRGWMVLSATLGESAPSPDAPDFHSAPSDWSRFSGQRGVAHTDLRLAGKARIGDELVDVVSLAEYLPRGAPVRVVEVEGVRVVVVRDETPAES